VARGWSAPGSPASWQLTAASFAVLARDDDLLAAAAEIPRDRLPALLFRAAACDLIAEARPTGLASEPRIVFLTAGRVGCRAPSRLNCGDANGSAEPF
jgi:hypothetical protein